jgi:UDPglucose 6-dehydrogenase
MGSQDLLHGRWLRRRSDHGHYRQDVPQGAFGFAAPVCCRVDPRSPFLFRYRTVLVALSAKDRTSVRDILCSLSLSFTSTHTRSTHTHVPQIRVCVVDLAQDRIDQWKTDNLPIFEPGLLEVVKESLGRNLFFSTDIDEEIKMADIVFISVNTPTKTTGVGAGRAANIKNCELCARKIAEVSTTSKIVVEKSTVPVRTAQAIARVMQANHKGLEFPVLSNPEFLAEGTAVQDLLKPDRVLIGGQQNEAGLKAAETLASVYANWVPREQIITTNLWSSECSKLVANAFLAQRVSSINSISALCEATGANVNEISRAVGMDDRIGKRFLQSSVGFGGSCFQKDILNLVYLCETYGLHECAEYWNQVILMNDYQKKRFSEKIVAKMFNTVSGKKICLFGYAFKKDTGDVRETPAMFVLRDLLLEQAKICVFDPEVKREDMWEELRYTCNITHDNTPRLDESVVTCTDPYEACAGAHAIAVLTEWDEFKTYDYKRIYESMAKPAFIFDGRNLLDHEAMREIGFEVHAVGKPDPNAFSDL